MKRIVNMALVCLMSLITAQTALQAGEKKLNVGEPAPKFQGITSEGKVWKSSDYVGKKIIVAYFYPADFTGGCTKQACAFRDDYGKLAKLGVEVVGISGDTVKTHALFKKYHKLNFTLLADPKGEIAKTLGVPQGKGGTITREPFGEKISLTRGVTIRRWTIVIDMKGNVALINSKVNAAKDSQNVMKVVKNLQK